MNLSQLNELIAVRNYVNNAINNFNTKKEKLAELSNMLIVLDDLIVNNILSSNFKDQIGYSSEHQAIKDLRIKNNIKSGLSKP